MAEEEEGVTEWDWRCVPTALFVVERCEQDAFVFVASRRSVDGEAMGGSRTRGSAMEDDFVLLGLVLRAGDYSTGMAKDLLTLARWQSEALGHG